MYKNFFMGIAAMAALTLVSCSSDDLNSLSDNSSKNEAISFDGYLGRSAVAVNGSRGSVLTKDKLKTDGFGVFGNYNAAAGQNFGSNLFNNEKVTFSSSPEPAKWTYTNTKYWPTEGYINFLAYAPYSEGTKLNENTSCIDFIVKGKATEQIDLLWANAKDQTKEKNSSPNKVEFKFAHALSRLGYSVKLKEAYSGATITLKKITLAGSATEPTKEAFYTKGTIDLSKPSSDANLWTISTPAEKQNFNWFSATQALSTTVYNNPNTDYLFVIPQDFSQKTSGADELYVIVEYTIQTGTTAIMTSTVSSQIKKNFEQGKAYMINLTIGLTPIEFDADVTDWGVDDEINIDSWK
jgi:hypothetical protein